MAIKNTELKKFAQGARRQLLEQVATRMEQVLRSDSIEIREKAKVVAELRLQILAHGKETIIDRVAYTWFNRFCALRFMDVNHYTRIGAVSPAEGGTQPEVLLEAKQGHVDEELARFVDPKAIFGLLNGQRPASDPQGEAYRLLLVGVCNSYSEVMPFLFEKIEDYTELLMPLDLLSENSVLHDLRDALTPEACQDVEVIGWLYQYYISERKDKVFEALKQNQKIEAGDIPAATQLFTPHWIVRYLVENSLGRLWMLNHPASKLVEKMEYYIAPAQEEPDYLRIASPEELRLLDPACGSGHILTYAFDLLAAIYEEEGYASSDIAKLILEKNIFGVEIDPRAGALAAFALVMKARAKDRRFFTRDMSPNICVLENVTFNEAELKQYMTAVGHDLFTEPLMETLRQFEQADNFGSLIRPMLTDAGYMRGLLEGKNLGGDLFLFGVHERVLKVLNQAEYLAPRYHVVVANPPYMGSKGMNAELKSFINDAYSDVKSDLFSAFIIRNLELSLPKGQIGLMTPFVWMFISSYEELRNFIINQKTITSLIQLEYSGFEGATVPICTFTLENAHDYSFMGSYVKLSSFRGAEQQSPKTLEAIQNPNCGWFYRCIAAEYKKILGSPIAYWISERARRIFIDGTKLSSLLDIKQGMATSDNVRFLRLWSEVSLNNVAFDCKDLEESETRSEKWYPYNKGGDFRRWYGNNTLLVNWWKNGKELKDFQSTLNQGWHVRLKSREYYFQQSITWSFISSAYFGVRYSDPGFIFDVAGSSVFPEEKEIPYYLGYLCSKLASYFLQILNPTLNFQVENIAKLPIIQIDGSDKEKITSLIKECISLSRSDWDASETSWNFNELPILNKTFRKGKQADTYSALRNHWQEVTNKMKYLEEQSNRIFIKAYGLQNEMTPDVPNEQITLTSNPYYRYSGNNSEDELEGLLRADTMKEFISYAVGCMFGRYSLDKPGLVLANQGETLKDYLKQVPKPIFLPDEDNVIPVLEGEWFEDDIAERFKKFLRVTFGEEHYDENLAFIEEAIGRDVRSYFVKEFYKDHVQTYKKRPIYWMFSSPKGSFNALIYMHRYQPDTVSIVLNGYLREYIKKLTAHKSQLERTSVSGSASQSQKTKALKEITQVNKILSELKEYEDDVLYPLATEQVKIDLDDGVKINYPKFGDALAKVAGL